MKMHLTLSSEKNAPYVSLRSASSANERQSEERNKKQESKTKGGNLDLTCGGIWMRFAGCGSDTNKKMKYRNQLIWNKRGNMPGNNKKKSLLDLVVALDWLHLNNKNNNKIKRKSMESIRL